MSAFRKSDRIAASRHPSLGPEAEVGIPSGSAIAEYERRRRVRPYGDVIADAVNWIRKKPSQWAFVSLFSAKSE
jgi:hypothetical protein